MFNGHGANYKEPQKNHPAKDAAVVIQFMA